MVEVRESLGPGGAFLAAPDQLGALGGARGRALCQAEPGNVVTWIWESSGCTDGESCSMNNSCDFGELAV